MTKEEFFATWGPSDQSEILREAFVRDLDLVCSEYYQDGYGQGYTQGYDVAFNAS